MTGINSTRTTQNRTDIFVVGAGPAGLFAAETLIKGGAKVTLVDRNQAPGSKACAGGLTRGAVKRLRIEASRVPVSRRFDSLNVSGPKGHTVMSPDDESPLLVTVDRQRLQAERIASLRDSGATVCLGERFLGFENNRAVTDRREWSWERLIGADGAQSRVRRELGLQRGRSIRALQIRLDKGAARAHGIDTDRPSVFFDSSLLCSGYGWIFPFDDELRMGIGLPASELNSPIRQIFSQWLARFGLGLDVSPLESGTITCEYQGHRFGSVYLAGDAAGMASPLTGEGIEQALVSGEEVALEILDATYRSEAIARLAAKHRRTVEALSATRLKKLLDVAPRLLSVDVIRKQALERFVF